MAEDRDRVVDRPGHEAHLEPEPRHGGGEQTAECHAAQGAQDGRGRVAVEVARSQPRQRQHGGHEDGEQPGAHHERPRPMPQPRGRVPPRSESAEGRRDRRPLRVGDHDGDRPPERREEGAERPSGGRRGAARPAPPVRRRAASAATNVIKCSGAGKDGAQPGGRSAGDWPPPGRRRGRRARRSSGARGASPPSSRFVRLRGVAGTWCASCRASAPSKALGEEIVHARGGRVVGRALTVRATAPSAGSGR